VSGYPAFRGTRPHGTSLTFNPPAKETEFSTARIDWYAVERAISGEAPRPVLTPEEAREAALFLRRAGVPRETVSTRLNVYSRLIREWEADAGMLGPDELCTSPGCQRARAGRGLCALCLSQVRIQERHWKAAVAELGVAA
jgi:hypothetical protein